MQIKDVMTLNVKFVEADETVQSAAVKMRARDIGALPVREEATAIGMVTDRDITIRTVADGLPPDLTPVRDAMTPALLCVHDNQDVEEVAKLMEERRIRRALVLNDQDKVAGIVSLGDLAVRGRDAGRELGAEVLEKVCEPIA